MTRTWKRCKRAAMVLVSYADFNFAESVQDIKLRKANAANHREGESQGLHA